MYVRSIYQFILPVSSIIRILWISIQLTIFAKSIQMYGWIFFGSASLVNCTIHNQFTIRFTFYDSCNSWNYYIQHIFDSFFLYPFGKNDTIQLLIAFSTKMTNIYTCFVIILVIIEFLIGSSQIQSDSTCF